MKTPLEKPVVSGLRFDRRVSPALLDAVKGGALRGLEGLRSADPQLRDLELRADAWRPHGWASLYCGLSAVIHAHEAAGRFWFTTHPSYAKHGFDATWSSQRMTEDQVASVWPDVEAFVEQALTVVRPMWTSKEGRVHGIMCSGLPTDYQIINREASPSFPKGSGFEGGPRETFLKELSARVWAAIPKMELSDKDKAWWTRKSIGTSPDLLAVDKQGRLLVIEAKWARDSQRTPWGPPQLAYYAQLWATALREDRAAPSILQEMLDQRVELGLAKPQALARPIRIVPVLAVGNGEPTREVMRRTLIVQASLDVHFKADPRVLPTSIWLIDDSTGDPRARFDRR